MNSTTPLDIAIAHHQAGRLKEAEALYKSILEYRPGDFDARHLLGIIHFQQDRHEQALANIAIALEANPNSAEAQSNFGLVLLAVGDGEKALAHFRTALALRPDFSEAYYNCGNALRLASDFPGALEQYTRALALKPDYFEALCNQGIVLRGLKRAGDALASFDRAIRLQPADAAAWNNRGTALQDLRQIDAALASYDQALALAPDYVDALHNRAMMLHEFYEDYERAIPDLEKLVALAPSYPFAQGALLHLRMQAADWTSFDEQVAAVEARMRAGEPAISPFAYQAISEKPADLLKCSQIYAAYRYPGVAAPARRLQAGDKIRLGYLAGEFRNHATSFLTAGLFEHHDRRKFELFAFDSDKGDGSAIRQRLETTFDRFVDISALPDRDAARAIGDLGIDILVNLNGYFGRERTGIFALRPSPLQVNWLGFPATLGADYMDYIIADAQIIPESEDRFYAEKVVRLPNTYQATDNRRIIGAHPTRQQARLPDGAFVFAWFNQSYKLTPSMFASWTRILHATPNSVLWLLESNRAFVANMRRAIARAGIASERLIFAPVLKPADHLARLWLADLFLDSLPYNAHTTASDALWAGLPVLTRRGSAFPGRVAASLLLALGLSELIVDAEAAYEAMAIELVGNSERLVQLRDELLRNRATMPLFDTAQFTKHMELAYRKMFDIAASGAPPRSFNI